INSLKSLSPTSNQEEEANRILDSIKQSVIILLEKERILDEQRSLKAKSSIDFEYNLVISGLLLTIIYYTGIIYILRRSFFRNLNRIMNNLNLAKNGSPLLTPPRLDSELSMLENEFYFLYKQ